jgi:SAM-dependent methyltransferase
VVELLGCATEKAAAPTRKEGVPAEEVRRSWDMGRWRDQVRQVIQGVPGHSQDRDLGRTGGLAVERNLLAVHHDRVDPKGLTVGWPDHQGRHGVLPRCALQQRWQPADMVLVMVGDQSAGELFAIGLQPIENWLGIPRVYHPQAVTRFDGPDDIVRKCKQRCDLHTALYTNMSSAPNRTLLNESALQERPLFQGWANWLRSPMGAALLDMEQSWLDQSVGDCFGYHAVQVSPPGLDALRKNRMGLRTRLSFGCGAIDEIDSVEPSSEQSILQCDAQAWPIANESVDLVVLVHALEGVVDPHGLLREAARVLIPEGRLVVVGFNPASLWALHRPLSPVKFPPIQDRWVAMGRVKDWCQLLTLQVEAGRHGQYRPVLQTETALRRLAWMDDAGARWWPALGAVYSLTAVKRRVGLRVIMPQWQATSAKAAQPVGPAAQKSGKQPL